MLNFLGGVFECTRRITASLSNGLEDFVFPLMQDVNWAEITGAANLDGIYFRCV